MILVLIGIILILCVIWGVVCYIHNQLESEIAANVQRIMRAVEYGKNPPTVHTLNFGSDLKEPTLSSTPPVPELQAAVRAAEQKYICLLQSGCDCNDPEDHEGEEEEEPACDDRVFLLSSVA